jgi:hypothetical protein
MDADDFRRCALELPQAEEKSHFEHPDFRVKNKIFGSLPDETRGVVKLTPDQQQMLTEAEPKIFSPVKGGWGRQGWTNVHLAFADEAALKSALRMSWLNVAPATLRKLFEPPAHDRQPAAKQSAKRPRGSTTSSP